MMTLDRAIARCVAGIVVVALAACTGADTATVKAFDRCRGLGDAFYQAERYAYSMDFAGAESLYLEVLAGSTDSEAATCTNLPSRARVMGRLAIVQSAQLQFLAAQESRMRAWELLAADNSEHRDILEQELATIELVDRMHRASIGGMDDTILSGTQRPRRAAAFQSTGPADDGLIEMPNDEKRLLVANGWDALARGAALTNSGRAQSALPLLVHGLESLTGFPLGTATLAPRLYLQKALAELALGRNAAAVASAEAAVRGLDEMVPNSAVAARGRFVLATALAEIGRDGEAVIQFDEAMSLYEQNPAAIQYESAWPFFRFALRMIGADPSSAGEWNARIFRAAQLVRSSGTVKAIARAAGGFATGDTQAAAAVRAWKTADDRLAIAKGLLLIAQQNSMIPPPHMDNLVADVAAADAAEREARSNRDAMAPEYRAALETPVSLPALQRTLRPGEAMVQILVGEPQSLLLVVLPQGTTGASVHVRLVEADREAIDSIVSSMRAVLEADYVDAERVAVSQFPADLSHAVYKLLFGDLAGLIEAQDRIFVASNGTLQNYPFDSLVISNPGDGAGTWRGPAFNYSGLRWLGDAVEVNYLPAARNLVDLRSRARPSSAAKSVLAFGDFRPGLSAEALMQTAGLPEGCRAFAHAVASAPPLPGTRQQVEGIASILAQGGEAVVSEDFTEAALEERRDSLGDYRILHFATHGLLPSSANCFTEPALLASFDPAGHGDSLLTTTEIRQFNLDAQLVVLSACETIGAEGQLQETGGESLSTLARAFFAAGSRSVIASQWQVLADETSQLMDAMYRRIAVNNAGFGAALRGAQRELRRRPESSHPAFWAAFVMVGDGTTQLYPDGGQTPQRRP